MADRPDPALLEVLSGLERAEAALLSWGFVDGGFSRDELLERIDALASDAGLDDPDEILEELLDQQLLISVRQGRRLLYRSRSAESIRLLARLRQLFPKHIRDGSWRHAPTLVADFRYSLRPRSYPDRFIPPAQALQSLDEGNLLRGLRREALAALLGGRGPGFELASFQVAATKRILEDLEGKTSRGTIVCSGTGSGKTLAFYLPALAHVADRVDKAWWTKAIAVYPRNELLKDQFSETFVEARRLDSLLQAKSQRKILIGAFFGPTPKGARAVREWGDWGDRQGAGYVCPFLRCPGCGGDLLWLDDDLLKERERLVCSSEPCAATIEEDEIILTRWRMGRTPPDILFTTTEMLNRQLADTSTGHIFGVGQRASRKPELMLLDEVHTYEGTTGAQAALVLRRWRHACGRPVQFVGLSATLREATAFFARLVGLPDHAVARIEPSPGEMVSEGMEYLLALRGDPVSGTSLLSTTIQTAMLLRRVLQPVTRPGDRPAYGSRVFLFTDDLEVTNRLYFDLLDAEARDSWGNPLPPQQRPTGALASLRSATQPDHGERLIHGQAWDMCEEIGHALDDTGRLRIGRTMAADPGVAAGSDVIVATASLDVGFNDATVGAVIQHKAPRGAAQFLQRKGRAGRLRGMRPWTVVVLSDYGRDRLAYQGYDLLFDPALEVRSLPVRNAYVLRMQAVFSFMDWVAAKLPSEWRGSVWLDFAGPPQLHQKGNQSAAERQEFELELINRVLEDEATREELGLHIRRALGLSEDQLQSVLWEPPRAILTHVLPTARRRLESGWSRHGRSGDDYQVRWQPLPDFVPSNLFSDLSLPEVLIMMPAAKPAGEETEAQMPVLQAMRTFAPGRVSRRFGLEHRYVRHWVPVDDKSHGRTQLDLQAFCDGEDIGEFRYLEGGGTRSVRCIRPWTIRTEKPPKALLDSSNSFLDWRTDIRTLDDGDSADIPSPSRWDNVIQDVRFYIHGRRSGLEIGRFAVGAKATLAYNDGRQTEMDVEFARDEEPAALGFLLDVDGFAVRCPLPRFFTADSRYAADTASLRSFRVALFQELLISDSVLGSHANAFQLQWLFQLYMSALVESALQANCTLEHAQDLLHAEPLHERLERILDVVFQSLPLTDDSEEGDAGEQVSRQRLHHTLSELTQEAAIADRLRDLAGVLWQDADARWQAWAEDRFRSTLGAALLEACDAVCGEVGARNLILDLDREPNPSTSAEIGEIWLSEPTIGGGGIVDEIARRYADDPRRFFRLVESALAPSDFELVDSELTRLLDWSQTDPDVRSALGTVRAGQSLGATSSAFRALLAALARKGLFVCHPVVAALNARVLRPGSSEATDAFLHGAIQRWWSEEERLGVEIDARVFAFAMSASDDIDRALGTPAPRTGSGERPWRFNAIYSLLWPRGSVVRANALQTYNPYHRQPPTDRMLVLSAMKPDTSVVDLSEPNWYEQLSEELIGNGLVMLRSSAANSAPLREAVLHIEAVAIDAGYMLLYPRVVGVDRSGGHVSIRLELREAYQ